MKQKRNQTILMICLLFAIASATIPSAHDALFLASYRQNSFIEPSLAFPISTPTSFRTHSENIQIDIDLEESRFMNSFIITNEGISDLQELEFSLPFEVVTLSIFQEKAKIPVKIQSTVEETTIQAKLLTPLGSGDSSKLTLYATTPSLVEQLGANEFLFLINFRFSTPQAVNLTIGLPPGGSLLNQSADNEFVLFPETTSNFSDGLRVYFYWENLVISSSQVVLIRFMFPQMQANQSTLSTPMQILFLFFSGFVVALLLVGGITYFLVRFDRLHLRYGKIDPEKVRPVHLSIPEHKIVKTLREAGGSMLQSDLVEEVQFSKAAVSQYLKKLEEKGVVAKEPAGRTNRIVLRADPSKMTQTSDS